MIEVLVGKEISVCATLRDGRDGFTKVIEKPWYVTDGDVERTKNAALHNWTEGNYACDCNRSLFMYGEDRQLPCDDGIAKVIELVRLEAGGEELDIHWME